MPDTTANKAKYIADNYYQFVVRIRRGTALASAIEEQTRNGQSLNSLVTMLLAERYGVAVPLDFYIHRVSTRIC